MPDTLRERIQRGDLGAFADPALPLHLLVEPGARWWRDGATRCLLLLRERLAARVDPGSLADAVDRWGQQAGVCGDVSSWRERIEKIRVQPDQGLRRSMLGRCVILAELLVSDERRLALHLDLALRLRALLPDAPADVDAALDALTRYAI